MSKFKVGDTAYIKDSGAGWIRVEIIRVSGSYYTIKQPDRMVAFGTAEHRLFTETEYDKVEPGTTYTAPWLH